MCQLLTGIHLSSFSFLLVLIWISFGLFIISTFATAISVWGIHKKRPEKKLFWLEMNFYFSFMLFVILTLYAVIAIAAITCTPIFSFHGETHIWTPDGSRMIRDISEGDTIYSYNVDKQEMEIDHVHSVLSHPTFTYYLINDVVKATAEHPIATVNNASIDWKKVKNLSKGDLLFSNNQEHVPITDLDLQAVVAPITVYNIHVSDNENYFILLNDQPVLVHNKSPVLDFDVSSF